MGDKRGVKSVQQINKEPILEVPADLEKKVVKTTEEIANDEEQVEEVEAVIDGVDMALNIRKDPEVKANNQIAILGKGVKIIVVDPKKTIKNKDGEWYKVKVNKKDDEDNKGYAMKKYIKVI